MCDIMIMLMLAEAEATAPMVLSSVFITALLGAAPYGGHTTDAAFVDPGLSSLNSMMILQEMLAITIFIVPADAQTGSCHVMSDIEGLLSSKEECLDISHSERLNLFVAQACKL